MTELPTGTVSLLFSDIEGSTLLLSRLGAEYTDALDAQRAILRRAWHDHGGVELGTEGDSFFVAFASGESAVAAAVKGQRELAAFSWPGGEKVRVRMGIHTGTPTVHDGGYVGMDVHRAARIAGAAHGGQVLVSAATAQLVSVVLTDDVALRDLGRHQLKDLALPEHLLQLDIAGQQTEFAPVKSLGAASSLPVPATPLVGRDGELAELTALLASTSEVRLLTLTGPGGSGKTRLAVGLARALVQTFPDGVYFVPLASVTSREVMWTSIGEALDIPPEGRTPPEFFTHVAHRSGLLVLDNLEQLEGADVAVSELLANAPQLVLVATSRRPLHLATEHEHPVPTLELPDEATLTDAERSGAVQLFVQRAVMVRPGFALTDHNVPDVIAVCRRLDGLPLAIELAAARSKLLSPAALAKRLDKGMELIDPSVDRPSRQRTLRGTIAWSYDLLAPVQQAFFRRLGVFAGGADLDAIAAVTAGVSDNTDVLDLLADLVDASLATASEGPDGEPRAAMLETVRVYANEKLEEEAELADTMRVHASHFVAIARQLSSMMSGGAGDLLNARRRLELELDNFREALGWALSPGDPTTPPNSVPLGLALCAALSRPWDQGGYFVEGRRWLELAIAHAGDVDSPDLAHCLQALGWLSLNPNQAERGLEAADRSVAMWRRLGDDTVRLSLALSRLAVQLHSAGDLPSARRTAEEAVDLAREGGDGHQLSNALMILSNVVAAAGDLDDAVKLTLAAVNLSIELGDQQGVLIGQEILACTYRELGRLDEAYQLMRDQIPGNLQSTSPGGLMVLAEDFGAVLADLGEYGPAVRLLGAADALRQRHLHPRSPSQETEIAKPFARARAALGSDGWTREYARGLGMRMEDALTEAIGPREVESRLSSEGT